MAKLKGQMKPCKLLMKHCVLSTDYPDSYMGLGENTIGQAQPRAVPQGGEVINDVQGLLEAGPEPTA